MKILLVLSLFSLSAFANTTETEMFKSLAEGKQVKCSLSLSYLLQTKEGKETLDSEPPRVVLMDKVSVEDPIPYPFSSHSLSWENDDYYFRYFMNSQSGGIRIEDKQSGHSAETELDIADLVKKSSYVGAVSMEKIQDRTVKNRFGIPVSGEIHTYLSASCRKL